MRSPSLRQCVLVARAFVSTAITVASMAQADPITARWLAPVTGEWTEVDKWSTNPAYPNGTDADAIIDAGGSGDYVVELDAQSIELRRLLIDSPDVTFLHTGPTLRVHEGVDLTAGTYEHRFGRLDLGGGVLTIAAAASFRTVGGDVAGGRITATGGAGLVVAGLRPSTAEFFDLTLATPVTIEPSSGLDLANVVFDGATISLRGGTPQAFASLFTRSGTLLRGTGEVVFDGDNAANTFLAISNLTISTGITVRTGTQGGQIGHAGMTLNNEGTIAAQTPTTTIAMPNARIINTGNVRAANGGVVRSAGTFENSGLVFIGDGSRLIHAGPLTNTGTIDVNEALILVATPATRDAALREVEQQILSARDAFPRWTGPGITSTAARTNPLSGLAAMLNPGLATFSGEMVDENAILVKYTYNGDANLDARITSDDYFRIDSGFLAQPTNPTYAQGDFNYDEQITSDDYFLIDSAFLGQGVPLGRAILVSASVPGPGVTAATVLGIASVTLRRRRHPQPRFVGSI